MKRILCRLLGITLAAVVATAVLCGVSQGIFIPTATVEAANALPPSASAVATSCVTLGLSLGQLYASLAELPTR